MTLQASRTIKGGKQHISCCFPLSGCLSAYPRVTADPKVCSGLLTFFRLRCRGRLLLQSHVLLFLLLLELLLWSRFFSPALPAEFLRLHQAVRHWPSLSVSLPFCLCHRLLNRPTLMRNVCLFSFCAHASFFSLLLLLFRLIRLALFFSLRQPLWRGRVFHRIFLAGLLRSLLLLFFGLKLFFPL